MRYLLSLAAVAVCLGAAQAREPSSDDARRLAARIDDEIARGYATKGVRPAPVVDDAAYLRRASLDVAGKIPTVNDVRKFLADPSPEKRVRAMERLLDSPGYANHFTNLYLDLLLPEAKTDFNRRYLVPTMHRWLRKSFATNTPYNKMVHELVALPMQQNPNQMYYYQFYQPNTKPTPLPFYFAKQGKPEELAQSVVRVFMGVRLECAQCHDHPFGKWKREEFWSQAAFFAGFKPPKQDFFFGPLTEQADRREMTIPNTDRVAQARFLDGKQPRWQFKIGARTTLADWMTSKDNPFFAKAMVNRMWAHFFGVGLVEPIDDIVDDNKPSHPELFEMLAREFASNNFDLKFLIKAITLSRTYQLASTADPHLPADKQADVRLFTRMPVKGLTGEQLFESVSQATGYRDNTNMQQRIFNFGSLRGNFLDKFTDQEKPTEYHTAIPQALTMMNNQLIATATHPDNGTVLGAITASSFMSTKGKVEALFLAALSRKPTAAESDKFVRYVERGGVSANQKKALGDVFWALLNSTEFSFNH
jgi:hypothetical protein